jgi:hypothetical protein
LAIKSSCLEEVQESLKRYGIKKLRLIIGVDFSEYNRKSLEENLVNLHEVRDESVNSYQEVLELVSRIFSGFGDPYEEVYPIHVFGFGDLNTKDVSVFPFILSRNLTPGACKGYPEVLKRYLQTTPTIILSHPTSFAPVIRESIKMVKESNSYHVLVILTPGQIDNMEDTKLSLKEASMVSLSIIAVGIGDGPFSQMYELYQTSQRAFQNFHFFAVNQVMKGEKGSPNREVAMSSNLLQDIPAHWTAIKKLGYPK